MAFNVGDTVGDYQIIGILGAGGMGKVYKVRNVISDRTEAMKVLLPNLAEAPELADRFIREIKLLASLNHPHIAGLHTALRMENQLLMMMEFVEGHTLEERLREGPITLWEAVDYMSQALSALGYAHERGVVHRDIKPANMMVTPQGQVKLMDFGIAKAMADRKLTMTGTTLGSLFYMSPEQVKGISTLDGRSDLYSVGVSLYEIVTGTRPFKGDSDYSIMVAHLEQQPVPPIQLDPTLPPGLDEVILTAIQKDPADRFQTAQAFRGALESVKQSLAPPVGEKPAVGAAAAAPPVMAPTQTGGVLRQPPAPAPQATPVPPAPMPAAPYAAPAPPPPYAAPVPPPQYAAPGPPPQYAAPVPPPAPPASHRGLYMALGGILVVAVLAVAAIYLPGWYRARAGGAQTPPVVDQQQQPPAQQQTEAAKPPVEPGAQTPLEPAAQPPGQGPAASAQPPATSVQPPSSAVQTPRQPPPPRTGSTQPPAGAVEPPVQPQHATAAPQQIPPPVDQEALDRSRERLGMLAARANAVRGTLQNLEQQQRSTGVGLRIDISASWKRMEFLLDEAEAALKRQDLAAAKRNLDNAERETDKLEQFLGR
ncbi:MAG: protein kinase [Bryobacteraceae bacterium]|jgi:serine/threonine-protein kinase